MLKLIIGLKGSGKTKTLIDMVNDKVESTDGAVVCLEKGEKLRHQIKYQARLINMDDYTCGEQLYGFVTGIVASNHDVKDIFIDSAIKMFDKNIVPFTPFILKLAEFGEKNDISFTVTSSIDPPDLPSELKKFV